MPCLASSADPASTICRGWRTSAEETIKSPWGEPSAALTRGVIGGLRVGFLPRHGKGHVLSPSDINYRANIDVLKRAGVTDLVSLSACGSFREDLPPGTFVLVDQFVDRTHKRESSFFGRGCVAHVSMAHPVSPRLHVHLAAAARAEGIAAVQGGTYVCMEGPQFSSLAESLTYKAQGYSVIGMTNMPEAKLARGGRDLLRQRGDGYRFRLLASRSRRRHRAGHHSHAELECRQGQGAGCASR